MDQTRHAKLEMPVEGLNVSTWNKIMSEAKSRGLPEIPIAGTCKVVLMMGTWPASAETPVGGSDRLEKFVQNFPQFVKNLEYDYSKDPLPGEVEVELEVSPKKSLVPSTRRRRKRGPGPISLDDSDPDESSGSDVLNQEFTPGVTYDTDNNTSMFTPGVTSYDDEDRAFLLDALREDLKYYERGFKRQYSYGAYGSSDPPTFMMDMMDVRQHCIKSGTPYVKMDVRHCITSSLTRTSFALPEESSGIMWVGVHTGNDICVATLRENVTLQTRLVSFVKSYTGALMMSLSVLFLRQLKLILKLLMKVVVRPQVMHMMFLMLSFSYKKVVY